MFYIIAKVIEIVEGSGVLVENNYIGYLILTKNTSKYEVGKIVKIKVKKMIIPAAFKHNEWTEIYVERGEENE